MQVTLPIEVYEAFEKVLGKDDAKKVVKTIKTTIAETTETKWKTSKEEMLEAMRKEFLTKIEFKPYFFILVAVIIITNSKALDIIGKLLGAVR